MPLSCLIEPLVGHQLFAAQIWVRIPHSALLRNTSEVLKVHLASGLSSEMDFGHNAFN